MRGYDADLDAVRRQLEHDFGFNPADQPLVDEAVRAAGGIPGGIPTKINVPLLPDAALGCRRVRGAEEAA